MYNDTDMGYEKLTSLFLTTFYNTFLATPRVESPDLEDFVVDPPEASTPKNSLPGIKPSFTDVSSSTISNSGRF